MEVSSINYHRVCCSCKRNHFFNLRNKTIMNKTIRNNRTVKNNGLSSMTMGYVIIFHIKQFENTKPSSNGLYGCLGKVYHAKSISFRDGPTGINCTHHCPIIGSTLATIVNCMTPLKPTTNGSQIKRNKLKHNN